MIREGYDLAPLIHGCGSRKDGRGGVVPTALAAGFGAASREAVQGLKEEKNRMLRMRARIETRLNDLFEDVRFHGQASPRLPNTVSFALRRVPGHLLVLALDHAGFAVSTGAVRPSGRADVSHVLLA